jgi:hypothetical protein
MFVVKLIRNAIDCTVATERRPTDGVGLNLPPTSYLSPSSETVLYTSGSQPVVRVPRRVPENKIGHGGKHQERS